MTFLYRIFSFLINLVAFFIVLALLLLLPASLAMPPLLFPVFVLVAVVLYTWFSNKFQRLVLRQQEVVRPSLKDWVKVNGYGCIVFCIMSIPGTLALLFNPEVYIANMKEAMKQLGREFPATFTTNQALGLSIFMIAYISILLAHVLWTFALIRKHKEYFQ